MFASFRFIHLHRASHLGTLDEPCEGRDIGAEHEDGVWWSIPKMEGPLECMPRVAMSPR
jgi:hypothetical protein